MRGKMILHYNHGKTKEEEYLTPEHAMIIVRRWTLNHNLPGKEHYIRIIPDEEIALHYDLESLKSEYRGRFKRGCDPGIGTAGTEARKAG